MEINQFIQNFAEQLDETEASQLTLDTKFRDLEEWSSIIALSIMLMAGEKYDVIITAEEMENAETIRNLYDIVSSRLNG